MRMLVGMIVAWPREYAGRISLSNILLGEGFRHGALGDQFAIEEQDPIKDFRNCGKVVMGNQQEFSLIAQRAQAVSYTHLTLPTIYSV